MARRLVLPVVLLACLSVVGARSAPAVPPVEALAESSAFAVRVIVPGAGASAAVIETPGDRVSLGPGFVYPADGSIVRTGRLSASVASEREAAATAEAGSQVQSIALFAGEVTATSVATTVTATATPQRAAGRFAGTRVVGLTVLGQPVAAVPGTVVPLADWGQLTVLEQEASKSATEGLPGYRLSAAGLHVVLTADHAGLAAGAEIFVGFAEAAVQGGAPPEEESEPAVAPAEKPEAATRKKRKRAPGLTLAPPRQEPPDIQPELTAGGYVFPVYGQTSWVDTWGTPRAAPVTWHHGQDIFAPLGAPVLAAADGTLFSVGWNDIGGLRLWLRDADGNEFYYAHLAALSTEARNGVAVKAGDVIGFVGNTGDARTTPYHLHFEIHPVSMLYLGYDGAVNPAPYLASWQRLPRRADHRRHRLGAASAARQQRAEARRDPAPGLGHLDGVRPGPGVAARRAPRPRAAARRRLGRRATPRRRSEAAPSGAAPPRSRLASSSCRWCSTRRRPRRSARRSRRCRCRRTCP